MKIRSITTGFNINNSIDEEEIKKLIKITKDCKREFENEGYDVQTIRIATQPWERYFKSKKQIIKLAKELEKITQKNGINYLSLGTTFNAKNIPLIYDLLTDTSITFCTAIISDDKKINYEAAKHSAKLIKKLSTATKDGFSNLKFAALFNVTPGCPFFPAAYHKGQTSFAIATENSDLVYKAFAKARKLEKAENTLLQILTKEYKKVEKIATKFSKKEKIKYGGIDVSIAPSVKPDESIAYGFEKLGLGRFGDFGTLSIAKVVTTCLKKLKIKKCGYSGLMLSVLEDHGLATRNKEGTYNIINLLLYSAVCGTGLDTIPLPGNISEKQLYALLLDIASLSIKLNKPLSARLMPVPNKNAGEMTQYTFEYFVNSKIMKI